MNNPEPSISVYIPTRNRAKLLERALKSVFVQTLQPREILVIDDASNDSTQSLLQQLKKDHPELIILQNKDAKGASASRNMAIRKTNGEFITGLDDDDFWKPDRLEKLYQAYHQTTYAGVCSYDQMDFGSKKITWKKKPEITFQDLLYYNMVGNQIFTKTEFLIEAGLFDETLPSAQDYDLWIRFTEKFGSILTVPDVLQVINMKNDEERITTSKKQIQGYQMCFEKHLPKMNDSQKRYQKYRLKLSSGESVGWGEMITSTPRDLLFKEIKRKLFL